MRFNHKLLQSFWMQQFCSSSVIVHLTWAFWGTIPNLAAQLPTSLLPCLDTPHSLDKSNVWQLSCLEVYNLEILRCTLCLLKTKSGFVFPLNSMWIHVELNVVKSYFFNSQCLPAKFLHPRWYLEIREITFVINENKHTITWTYRSPSMTEVEAVIHTIWSKFVHGLGHSSSNLKKNK